MNLENITLSERSHTQSPQILYEVIYMKHPEKENYRERLGVAKGWVEG